MSEYFLVASVFAVAVMSVTEGRPPRAAVDVDLQSHFDRKEMARWDVGGMGRLEEDDSVLDMALIPTFKRFQAFYKRAAESGHYVLVVYQ